MMRSAIVKYIVPLIFGCIFGAEVGEQSSESCHEVNDNKICYDIESVEPRSWSDAFKTCKEKNSALPIIRSVDEQTALQMYMTSLKSSLRIISVWTSGQNKKHDWTWVDGQKLSNDMKFLPGVYNATYAILTYNSTLMQKFFQAPAQYICQYNGPECQQANSIPLKNSCVIVGEYFEPWPEARRDCKSSGGDLAVLTKEDIQIIKENTAKDVEHLKDDVLKRFGYWIGLRAESWFWITGDEDPPEEVTYTKWAEKLFLPSDSQCIFADTSTGTWKASACSKVMSSVVCERRSAITNLNFVNQQNGYQTAIWVTVAIIIGVLCGVIVILVIKRRRERRRTCSNPQHQVGFYSLQANEAMEAT